MQRFLPLRRTLNLSYNRFSGPAPVWLEELLNSSSPSVLLHVDNNCLEFSASLLHRPYQRTNTPVCDTSPPTPSPSGLPTEAIVGIIAAVLVALMLLIVVVRKRPAIIPVLTGATGPTRATGFDELKDVPSPQPA